MGRKTLGDNKAEILQILRQLSSHILTQDITAAACIEFQAEQRQVFSDKDATCLRCTDTGFFKPVHAQDNIWINYFRI